MQISINFKEESDLIVKDLFIGLRKHSVHTQFHANSSSVESVYYW